MCQCICALGYQVIDLKGELANSKAGQAAIKQAVDTAAKEQAASAAREKSLKVCHALYLLHAHALVAHRGIINGDIHLECSASSVHSTTFTPGHCQHNKQHAQP